MSTDAQAGLDALAAPIEDALRTVIDPELGYNVVDLGLVYKVDIMEGGLVEITFTTTTPGCPATAYIQNGVQEAAWSVPGVEFVNAVLTYEPRWHPEMMSEDAKRHLGFA